MYAGHGQLRLREPTCTHDQHPDLPSAGAPDPHRDPRTTLRELAARRAAALPAGLVSSAGVYAAEAGGGVLVDVDGNSFIDLGSGIAVTTVGNAAPAVAARAGEQLTRFTHTCFLATPYRGLPRRRRAAQPLTPAIT